MILQHAACMADEHKYVRGRPLIVDAVVRSWPGGAMRSGKIRYASASLIQKKHLRRPIDAHRGAALGVIAMPMSRLAAAVATRARTGERDRRWSEG
jgi:hypothetical protein